MINKKKKDDITIDVNPEQADDIETLEDPNNKVLLNSVLSKTQKKLRNLQIDKRKDMILKDIEKFGENLDEFDKTFKIKMHTLNRAIEDYKEMIPSVPLLNLSDV